MPNDDPAELPRVAQAAWVARVLGVAPAQGVPALASAAMPAEGIPEATRSGAGKLVDDIDRLKQAAANANNAALRTRIEALRTQVAQLKVLAAGSTDGGPTQSGASVAQVSPVNSNASKPPTPCSLPLCCARRRPTTTGFGMR